MRRQKAKFRGLALALAWLACGVPDGAAAQTRTSVSIPASAGRANYVALDLAVRSLSKPADGSIAAVVRLRRAGSGNGVEIGRISLVTRSFDAGSADDRQQRFQFDITHAVRQLDLAGGSAEVEVALIDRATGSSPSGARIAIGSAQVSAR